MTLSLPLEKWLAKTGLCIIEFPVELDYEVLYKVLETLEGASVAIIHSKPIEYDLWKTVKHIDATLHTRTVDSRMRHRVAEDSILRLNPFSTQNFIVSLKKQAEKARRELDTPLWWLWWTPSDLAIQKVDDSTIVECMGAIGSEYRDAHFIVFVAREAHTARGLSLLQLAPRVLMSVEYAQADGMVRWTVLRHPDREMRGDVYEYAL